MKPYSYHDFVIVGASVSGCITAILLAQNGYTVALVERASMVGADEDTDTRYIPPSAIPILRHAGVEPVVVAAGGRRCRLAYWTRHGWIAPIADDALPYYGYTVRREVFRPMLRHWAAETPGITLYLGYTVERLLRHPLGYVQGALARCGDTEVYFYSRWLTVGADGAASAVGRLMLAPVQEYPQRHTVLWGYYRSDASGVGDSTGHMWLHRDTAAWAFSGDDGRLLVACAVPAARVPSSATARHALLEQTVTTLPYAPSLSLNDRRTAVLTDSRPIHRREKVVGRGCALIGRAALTMEVSRSASGAWAFQSAQWLVNSIVMTLGSGSNDVNRILARYQAYYQAYVTAFRPLYSRRPAPFLDRFDELYAATAPYNASLAHLWHTTMGGHLPPTTRTYMHNLVNAAKVYATRQGAAHPLANRPTFRTAPLLRSLLLGH